jgi:hypothetical protein
MTVMQQGGGGGGGRRSGTLYDVLELVLDRGLVIDAFVRVSLVGIELLRIDVRVVVASVDTYLRFAEACNRLDLDATGGVGLPDLVSQMGESGGEKVGERKTKGAISGAAEGFADAFRSGRGESDEEEQKEPARKPARRSTRRKEES